jgi:hypothetical protein
VATSKVGAKPVPQTGTARKRGMRQQKADCCEIAVVDELGVGCDEALDRPAARFLIGGAH